MRESPSLVLMSSLLNLNADVDYYDPFVPIIPPSREYIELTGMKGIKSLSKSINTYDAVIISDYCKGFITEDDIERQKLIM